MVGLHLPTVLRRLKPLQCNKEWFGLSGLQDDEADMAKLWKGAMERWSVSGSACESSETHHLMGESSDP